MLFETREAAQAIANHLDLDAVAGGIKVRPACWMAITRAKNPIISLFPAPPPRPDKGGTHNYPKTRAARTLPVPLKEPESPAY